MKESSMLLLASSLDRPSLEKICCQTIEVPPAGIRALEAGGAKPRMVAPWRVQVGRWLGQPVLSM
jgi:hypothetical protein